MHDRSARFEYVRCVDLIFIPNRNTKHWGSANTAVMTNNTIVGISLNVAVTLAN